MSELSSVAEVFARYLEARDQGQGEDIETWCRQFPALAERLRRMHADWTRLESALGASATRAERERYEVGECLAHGGMGAVHRAYDHHLRRELAMKILRRPGEEKGTNDPRSLSRFLDEARITGQLQHPGIPAVHDLGIDREGNVYFTMPLVPGGTLREIIDRCREGDAEWPLQRVLGVLLKVCEAVAFAHAQGVIHRDLKPGNVMVGRFGESYVMDWGLARVLAEGETDAIVSERRRLQIQDPPSPLATRDGDVVGTPSYMPPEQARGELHKLGPRSDVYAAGAMLYHVVAGEPPYGTSTSSLKVLDDIAKGPPPRLDLIRPAAPAELVAICARAMAWEPERRYADMGELAADLRAFLELRVVRAHGGGAFTALRKFVQRNKAMSLAIAAAFAALLAGTVISLQQKRVAEHSSVLALDAIEQMLERVASTRLDDVPRAYPVRQELAQDALALYQRLLEVRGGDLETRRRMARCWQRLGHFRTKLGDSAGSEAALRESIAAFDQLLTELPGREDLLQSGANSRLLLATVLIKRPSLDEAEQLLRRAVDDLTPLLPGSPGLAQRLDLLSNIHGQLGEICGRAERPAGIVEEKGKMVALARQLVALEPTPARWKSLARSVDQLGFALFQQGQIAAAEPLHRDAVEILTPLYAAAPHAEGASTYLASALNNLGRCMFETGRKGEARACWLRAIELWQATIDRHPEVPTYHSVLGTTLGNAAIVEPDLAASLAHWQRATREHRTACAKSPDNSAFRAEFVRHLTAEAIYLSDRNRHLEVAATADVLASVDPAGGDLAMKAAAYLAHCIGFVQKDASLPAAERQQLEAGYRAGCVAHLQRALANGCRDRARYTASHFAPLQGEPAYAVILQELDKQ